MAHDVRALDPQHLFGNAMTPTQPNRQRLRQSAVGIGPPPFQHEQALRDSQFRDMTISLALDGTRLLQAGLLLLPPLGHQPMIDLKRGADFPKMHKATLPPDATSEERRVGKEWGSTGRSRW